MLAARSAARCTVGAGYDGACDVEDILAMLRASDGDFRRQASIRQPTTRTGVTSSLLPYHSLPFNHHLPEQHQQLSAPSTTAFTLQKRPVSLAPIVSLPGLLSWLKRVLSVLFSLYYGAFLDSNPLQCLSAHSRHLLARPCVLARLVRCNRQLIPMEETAIP